MIVLANHSLNLIKKKKLDVIKNTVWKMLRYWNFNDNEKSSPGERFWEEQWDWITCSLVGVDVSIFCFSSLFSFFALHGGNEPHYSRETLKGDVVQPRVAHSVTDELRMMLLASYRMNKVMMERSFIMNWILTQHS